MRKFAYTICAMLILQSAPALASDYIAKHISNPAPVGSGRMSVMLWDVYDATLYAPEGLLKEDRPLALKLSYLLKLNGKKIADRSVKEMRDQGFKDEVKLATWHTQMRKIFPDVDNGTSITGVYTKSGETIFYGGDAEIGRINDPEFSKAFFGIWLNEKTNAPALRQQLIGAR